MPDVSAVRDMVQKHFPELWPAVDVGLSVCASLFLEDNKNPVALIYVGGAGSSKTTVANFFNDHVSTYRSDNFTAASFVSQAANVQKKDLEKVDLLPRIKHKVLVTPEMGPIFRGKEDELATRLSIVTRVLDGQGYVTDSGTHGQRGYTGEHLFGWLGCTTPLDDRVWRVMAQLGSRLFFWHMGGSHAPTVDDLVSSTIGPQYGERCAECKKAVHSYLNELSTSYEKVQGVHWESENDPKEVVQWIGRLAQLIAAMRSKEENPRRAFSVLRNIARGHALVHGRRQLTRDDLPTVAWVALSSIPREYALMFWSVIDNDGEPVTVADVQKVLGLGHHQTAANRMQEMAEHRVMVFDADRQPATLYFAKDWDWCTSSEAQADLWDPLVKSLGLCLFGIDPTSITSEEEIKIQYEEYVHPPETDKCRLAMESLRSEGWHTIVVRGRVAVWDFVAFHPKHGVKFVWVQYDGEEPIGPFPTSPVHPSWQREIWRFGGGTEPTIQRLEPGQSA